MMSGQISAEIGHWYRPFSGDNLFEVVAIDYDDQVIEVQHFDGEVEEIDFNGWKTIIPIETSPPEDWTGPFEINRQDPAFNDYAIHEAIISLKPPKND